LPDRRSFVKASAHKLAGVADHSIDVVATRRMATAYHKAVKP